MKFEKYQALGNDFLLVAREAIAATENLGALAAALCDRHFGAGADGIVVVERDGERIAGRVFNADGGEAEVSGNGTRCVAAWLDRSGVWGTGAQAIRIHTAVGPKVVRRTDVRGRYQMEMGAPVLASAGIPVRLDPPVDRVVGRELEANGSRVVFTAVSVGNPHCTIFVDDFDRFDWRALGAAVERHELFPNRVNVEFSRVLDRGRMEVRFWERGVGETLASGTGASAATVAAVLEGRTDRRVRIVTASGAELEAEWSAADGVVRLTGPAAFVYAGEWPVAADAGPTA